MDITEHTFLNSTEEDTDSYAQIPIPEDLDIFKCPNRTGKRDFLNDPVLVYEPAHDESLEELKNCPIRCLSTGRQNFEYIADIVLLGAGGIAPPKEERPCKQVKYMINSMESEVNYPNLMAARLGQTNFDWISTYRLDSDIPMPYFDFRSFDLFRKLPEDEDVKKDSSSPEHPTVVSFISNCGPEKRLNYIRELSKYIPVSNYGQCLRNVPNEGYVRKDEIIPKKKFVLVFENTETWDYATEKFYDALTLGSIPVVLGSPNVAELAPDMNSFIDVKDFSHPKELAKYLLYLDENETEWYKYMEWKNRGLDPRFESKLDMSLLHSRCRLCLKVAGLNYKKFLSIYKKKYLRETTFRYVTPAPVQPDWSKQYAKFERDIKLFPGKAKADGSSKFIEILDHYWQTCIIDKKIDDKYAEFKAVVTEDEYTAHLDILTVPDVYKKECSKGTGRNIETMRELEYLFTERYQWIWSPNVEHSTVFHLPIKMCYDRTNKVAWVLHGYETAPITQEIK